jgi:hypothetical protein
MTIDDYTNELGAAVLDAHIESALVDLVNGKIDRRAAAIRICRDGNTTVTYAIRAARRPKAELGRFQDRDEWRKRLRFEAMAEIRDCPECYAILLGGICPCKNCPNSPNYI